MLLRIFLSALFLFFCNLHAKNIYLDVEADLPNKSSVSIVYHDKINHFSPEDLHSGVVRKNVFDVHFFTNLKAPFEVILSSKDAEGEMFSFVEELSSKKLPFYLFGMEKGKVIENGGIIFSEDNLIKPVSKVISVGMRVPKIKVDGLNGELFTHFTVTLQHTG